MKKVFALLAVAFTITLIPMQNVQACENNVIVQMTGENVNAPRADVIVRKYRVYNGVTQYRRWNETQGCWVDPDWIDVN